MNTLTRLFSQWFYRLSTLALVAWLSPSLCLAQSMFRGNPAHTGIYNSKGPRELHGLKWKFPTGGRILSSPVMENGVIYFGSYDFNLYAVDAETGRQKWQFATTGPIASTPAIANGIVYFGSYDGRFYAVDASTGKLKWRFRTAGERHFEAKGIHGTMPATQTFPDAWDMFQSSPVVAQGIVFFGSGDTNFYALDAATGALRWKFATGDVVHSSPAYDSGTVYFGSWDSYLYALDAATGQKKWQFKTGEDPVIHNQVGFQSSPAIANGVLYVGCRDAHLYAIDAASGTQKWSFDNHGTWIIGSPSPVGDKVVVGTSDPAFLDAFEAASGKSIFKLPMGGFVFSSPAIADDVAYVGLLNGVFVAVDIKTGKQLWDFQTELSRQNRNFYLKADKSLNESALFLSVWDNNVFAVERIFSLGAIASSPLVANGTVYFGSTDGYLYTLN